MSTIGAKTTMELGRRVSTAGDSGLRIRCVPTRHRGWLRPPSPNGGRRRESGLSRAFRRIRERWPRSRSSTIPAATRGRSPPARCLLLVSKASGEVAFGRMRGVRRTIGLGPCGPKEGQGRIAIRTPGRRNVRGWVTFAVAGVVFAFAVEGAQAAFPGENGRIAFTSEEFVWPPPEIGEPSHPGVDPDLLSSRIETVLPSGRGRRVLGTCPAGHAASTAPQPGRGAASGSHSSRAGRGTPTKYRTGSRWCDPTALVSTGCQRWPGDTKHRRGRPTGGGSPSRVGPEGACTPCEATALACASSWRMPNHGRPGR
jgi:hypothetical protein